MSESDGTTGYLFFEINRVKCRARLEINENGALCLMMMYANVGAPRGEDCTILTFQPNGIVFSFGGIPIPFNRDVNGFLATYPFYALEEKEDHDMLFKKPHDTIRVPPGFDFRNLNPNQN